MREDGPSVWIFILCFWPILLLANFFLEIPCKCELISLNSFGAEIACEDDTKNLIFADTKRKWNIDDWHLWSCHRPWILGRCSLRVIAKWCVLSNYCAQNAALLSVELRYDGLEARQTSKLQNRRPLCLMLNCTSILILCLRKYRQSILAVQWPCTK
jgi:hypothetical protein